MNRGNQRIALTWSGASEPATPGEIRLRVPVFASLEQPAFRLARSHRLSQGSSGRLHLLFRQRDRLPDQTPETPSVGQILNLYTRSNFLGLDQRASLRFQEPLDNQITASLYLYVD